MGYLGKHAGSYHGAYFGSVGGVAPAEPLPTTTLYATVRDAQARLIEALTPATLADRKFRRDEGRIDFKAWAQANQVACLRRFSIIGSLRYAGPFVSSTEWETYRTDTIVTVAYPKHFGLYGQENSRAMSDVMRADMKQIDTAIGHRGFADFVGGQNTSRLVSGPVIDEAGNVMFATMTFEVEYQRSV